MDTIFDIDSTSPLYPTSLPSECKLQIVVEPEEWQWDDLGDDQGEVEHFSRREDLPYDHARHGDHLSQHFKPYCDCGVEINEPHEDDCLWDFTGDPRGWRRLPAQSQSDNRENWWRPGEHIPDEEIENAWEYACAVWTGDAPVIQITAQIVLGATVLSQATLGMVCCEPWHKEDPAHKAEILGLVADNSLIAEAVSDIDAETLMQQADTMYAVADWINQQ